MKLAQFPLRRFAGLLAALALGPAGWVAAAEADYPNKPVKIIVGFPAGQGTDTIARAMASKLQVSLGQTFIVDNKPGAGGILGQQAAAVAAPDGYTILLTSAGPMAVNPGVYEKLPYDPIKDYTAVGSVINVPLVMVANTTLPAKNLKELLALAKTKPGEINFGSSGNGVTNHLAMEMLNIAAGTKMTHVPYKGSPPALTDLMAGRISVMFDTPVAVLPFVKDGRLKAIAVSGATRIGALPDVPTVAEMGFKDFETSQWYGILAPAGTPRDIVKRLQEESLKALKSNAVTERFASDSAIGGGGPPEEFAAYIAQQQKIWKDIVVRASIKAD